MSPGAAKRHGRILLVDDDPGVRKALARYLGNKGFDVVEAETARDAEDAAASGAVDLAIVDQMLPDGTGMELLPRIRAVAPGVPFVILTAHGTIDLAVQAIKSGADQFLTKPIDVEALLLVASRLIEERRNRRKQLADRPRTGRPDPFLGTTDAIRRLADEAAEVRDTDRTVLIQGETGSGKGVLARWLHDAGPRSDEAFVELNCAGISRDLLDAELFGHEAGAFTGAVKAKLGLLEVAHQGSVFLDEVGDMDVGIQARMLKVLEEKSFRRLGNVRERFVDIRLIAATHHDLAQRIADGRFREDLYYRLSAIELHVPPLRERIEDLPLLAQEILDGFARETGREVPGITSAAREALAAHSWPGNVRELRNVLEAAVLRCRTRELGPDDLRLRPARGTRAAREGTGTLAEVEGRHIRLVLAAHKGNVGRAARVLDISPSSLYDRMKRMGLEAAGFKGAPVGTATPAGDEE